MGSNEGLGGLTDIEKLGVRLMVREEIKKLTKNYSILELYPLTDPWAWAVIVRDRKTGEIMYYVYEVPLNNKEKKLLKRILDMIYWEIEAPPPGIDTRAYLEEVVRKAANKILKNRKVREDVDLDKILYYIHKEVMGYGEIDPLMRDPYVEDISASGANRPVYVVHQKYGSIPTNIVFDSVERLDAFIQRLAYKAGKHVSVAHPTLDAMLPDKHRIAATYGKEVSMGGSSFTIRKYKEEPLSIVDLIIGGTLTPQMAAYAWMALDYKLPGLILGVTGSGKTTLLNSLLNLVNPHYKIVTIEDTPELRLLTKNWVQLYPRHSYTASKVAEVSLFDLVKLSLRYRPDIIVVGEVRGEEAKVLFQAIATGHGGVTSIHAEDIDAAIKRLVSPPMSIPPGHISLLDFAMKIDRIKVATPEGVTYRRVVTRLWDVLEYNNYMEVFKWNDEEASHELVVDLKESYIVNKIASMTGRSVDSVVDELNDRTKVLQWLAENNIRDYRTVGLYIYRYHTEGKMFVEKLARTKVSQDQEAKI